MVRLAAAVWFLWGASSAFSALFMLSTDSPDGFLGLALAIVMCVFGYLIGFRKSRRAAVVGAWTGLGGTILVIVPWVVSMAGSQGGLGLSGLLMAGISGLLIATPGIFSALAARAIRRQEAAAATPPRVAAGAAH